VVCSLSTPDTNAICKFTGHTDEVNTVCWSPGGEYVASCSDDHTAKIWTLSGLLHNLTGHLKEIYTVRWTPTGKGSPNPDKPLYLCTASFDGNVKVWNSITGGLEYNLRRHAQPVYSISSNPTGELLATGSLGGHVSVWNLKTGELVS
jgi:transducin (beta)-like 1